MQITKDDLLGSNNSSNAGNLVFSALVKALGVTNGADRLTEWMEKVDYDNRTEFEAKLTIEGVELDLKAFADRWDADVNRLVALKAVELIRDKFIPITDMLSDMEKEVIKNTKTTLGVELDEEDYY